MSEDNSYDLRLTQARALSGQLGLFAEENEIPKDLWDRLESEIYNYYQVNLNWCNLRKHFLEHKKLILKCIIQIKVWLSCQSAPINW